MPSTPGAPGPAGKPAGVTLARQMGGGTRHPVQTMVLDFEGLTLMSEDFVCKAFRVFVTSNPQMTWKTVNLSEMVTQAVRIFAP